MTKNNTPKVREYQEDGSFIDRDMTDAELAQAALDSAAAQELEALKTAQEIKKQQVLDKLGLTAEEVSSLLA